jgi:hypothetical protein
VTLCLSGRARFGTARAFRLGMNLERRATNVLISAGLTTAATTGAALIISKLETGSAAAGLNATSHIVWGDEAASVDHFAPKYTVVGGLLNAGAMLAWSVFHELMPQKPGALGALSKGMLTSGVAYLTDYRVVPGRLTPGFEKRFSPRGMSWMYGVLGAAFALAGGLTARRR